MGLRAKIMSGFLILATMLIIAGVWSVFSIKYAGQSVNEIMNNNYKSMNAALSMSDAIAKININTLHGIGNDSEFEKNIFTKADSLFSSALKTANENITIEEERELISDIRNLYNEFYLSCLSETEQLGNENNFRIYLSQSLDTYRNLKMKIDKLFLLNDTELYSTAIHITDRSERAVMPGIVAVISAIVFTLLFSYLINVFVIIPIKEITKRIQKFTDNRVPFEYSVSTNDEISELTDSVDTLCAHIASEE